MSPHLPAYQLTTWLARIRYWIIKNIYSEYNAIWLRFDVALHENTLDIIITGANHEIFSGNQPDLFNQTEERLNLPHKKDMHLSYYSPDWKSFKQQVKRYFLEYPYKATPAAEFLLSTIELAVDLTMAYWKSAAPMGSAGCP